ncbi:winged helix-turn-helix domain-containing protein [Vibrio fluvialis]|nr:winged helix-turn-helix domain-containing protein [Vibrio fluvialis]
MAYERAKSREPELNVLRSLLSSQHPDVVCLHGLMGVGKSALLEDFARLNDKRCCKIDCRTDGNAHRDKFRKSLKKRIQTAAADTVLLLDHLDCQPELEAWLRCEFLPRTPHNTKVVFARRQPPHLSWMTNKSPHLRFRAIKLATLSADHALAYLSSLGVEECAARTINNFALGHPTLLNILSADTRVLNVERYPSTELIHTLMRYFFASPEPPGLLGALECLSFLSRANEPALAYLAQQDDCSQLYQTLCQHWSTETHHDGISLIPVLGNIINRQLQARDPERFQTLLHLSQQWQQLDCHWFDSGARQLKVNQHPIDLTPLEFGVLSILFHHQGAAVSRKLLLEHVWGIHFEGSSNVVDTIIVSLRRKLCGYAHCIETVRGVGYRLSV